MLYAHPARPSWCTGQEMAATGGFCMNTLHAQCFKALFMQSEWECARLRVSPGGS